MLWQSFVCSVWISIKLHSTCLDFKYGEMISTSFHRLTGESRAADKSEAMLQSQQYSGHPGNAESSKKKKKSRAELCISMMSKRQSRLWHVGKNVQGFLKSRDSPAENKKRGVWVNWRTSWTKCVPRGADLTPQRNGRLKFAFST